MVERALQELKRGKIILLHDSDGRENEVDMVVHASAVTPQTIRTLRKDAGGLICLAIGGRIAEWLKLPYMADLLEDSNDVVRKLVAKKTPYGDKPAFSITINHRETYTGITDNDRALTITEFGKTEDNRDLIDNFYSPGHVPLLIARTLKERRGHTELSIELARRAGLRETMVLCEMLADDGKALSLEEAAGYARRNGLVLVDGGEL